MSAGAAAQAEFPATLAGSGSGRGSPENLLIRRGQRGSSQSAREGAGPARPIGPRGGGLAPRRAGLWGSGPSPAPRAQGVGGGPRETSSRQSRAALCLHPSRSMSSWVPGAISPVSSFSLPCSLLPSLIAPLSQACLFLSAPFLFLFSTASYLSQPVAVSVSLCLLPLSASPLLYHSILS